MNSTTALLLARARQDELLRDAERRPRREPARQGGERLPRRYDLLRWLRIPRLADGGT